MNVNSTDFSTKLKIGINEKLCKKKQKEECVRVSKRRKEFTGSLRAINKMLLIVKFSYALDSVENNY